MAITTVRIPKDNKHRIVMPNEIWEAENLNVGDLIQIEVIKIEKKNIKSKE